MEYNGNTVNTYCICINIFCLSKSKNFVEIQYLIKTGINYVELGLQILITIECCLV